MREIRFRAWDDTTKSFNYWGFLNNPFECFQGIVTGGDTTIDYVKKISEQYTGLKDKNGIEIYEGDICKPVGCGMTHFKTGAVELYRDKRGMNTMCWTFGGSHNFENGDNWEVIGNIHKENK